MAFVESTVNTLRWQVSDMKRGMKYWSSVPQQGVVGMDLMNCQNACLGIQTVIWTAVLEASPNTHSQQTAEKLYAQQLWLNRKRPKVWEARDWSQRIGWWFLRTITLLWKIHSLITKPLFSNVETVVDFVFVMDTVINNLLLCGVRLSLTDYTQSVMSHTCFVENEHYWDQRLPESREHGKTFQHKSDSIFKLLFAVQYQNLSQSIFYPYRSIIPQTQLFFNFGHWLIIKMSTKNSEYIILVRPGNNFIWTRTIVRDFVVKLIKKTKSGWDGVNVVVDLHTLST